jgi:hypothetical protein
MPPPKTRSGRAVIVPSRPAGHGYTVPSHRASALVEINDGPMPGRCTGMRRGYASNSENPVAWPSPPVRSGRPVSRRSRPDSVRRPVRPQGPRRPRASKLRNGHFCERGVLRRRPREPAWVVRRVRRRDRAARRSVARVMACSPEQLVRQVRRRRRGPCRCEASASAARDGIDGPATRDRLPPQLPAPGAPS